MEAKLVKGKTAVTANVTGNAKTIYVSVKLDNGKFTITVSGTEEGATSTTYTYTVESIGTYDAKITTNVDGAQVRVYQGDTLVTPGKDGVYSLRTADFDRDPYLLNCQNGTLNLRTGEFREHRLRSLTKRAVFL